MAAVCNKYGAGVGGSGAQVLLSSVFFLGLEGTAALHTIRYLSRRVGSGVVLEGASGLIFGALTEAIWACGR